MPQTVLRPLVLAFIAQFMSACSTFSTDPEPAHSIESAATPSTAAPHEEAYSSAREPGQPLWIWIAPEYRKELPAGSGAYLIESI